MVIPEYDEYEGRRHDKPTGEAVAASDGSAIREFLSALVEMTEGAADIDKRSIVKPGVTLRQEARRLLARVQRRSADEAVRAIVERIRSARELSHSCWRTYREKKFVVQCHYAAGQLDAFDAVLIWINESPALTAQRERARLPNDPSSATARKDK